MTPVRIEQAGPIATLVLARPEVRNAMSEEMGRAVQAAVSELNGRDDVRVVVVRGEGKCFSAGGDLSYLDQRAATDETGNRAAMRAFYELFLSIRALRVPSIAVLHGTSMGAGVCFAMACDLRIAAADAKLGLNFVRLGLHPGMGATYLLPRLVGPARAALLLLTGSLVGAEEALRIGLVNEVCPPEDLDATVARIAAEIARAAPLAVAHTKRTLVAAPATLEAALDAEATAQASEYGSEDLREGVRAVREKRAPVFTGR